MSAARRAPWFAAVTGAGPGGGSDPLPGRPPEIPIDPGGGPGGMPDDGGDGPGGPAGGDNGGDGPGGPAGGDGGGDGPGGPGGGDGSGGSGGDGGDGPGGPGGEPPDPPVPPGDAVPGSALRTLSATRMGRRLTTPFERGADTLTLTLRSTTPTVATVDSYDFADFVARFDRAPRPEYVLGVVRDVALDTTVTVSVTDPGSDLTSVTMVVPAGTRAGASARIPLAGPVPASLRVVSLTMTPAAADPAAQVLSVTALLGNLAKVLWVVGGERDVLRGQAVRTMAQRHLPAAEGLSLDLIGADLGVPRFPPLPYTVDGPTTALFHLDDPARTLPVVSDATTGHPGRSGHPGQATGAVQAGVAGRYGTAFGFAPGASVTVPSSAEFDLPVGASQTIECFVRPDPASTNGPILARHPHPGGAGAGWVLAVGTFDQGRARNVQFVLTDGGDMPVVLSAGVSLATDTFTHVAVVVDGPARTATLFVDGQPRTSARTGMLGPVVNTAPLRIGPAGGGFRGVLDEVRVSAVARTSFAPTLGEADDHYRRRLTLFRRWTLPTPANLTAILNELTGPISGHDNALVVDDANSRLIRGTRLVRVRPVSLRLGECVDGAGRRRVTEAEAVGTAAQEDMFDPAFLLRYDRGDVDFGQPPDRELAPREAAPDAHLVQVGLAARLDRLVALAGAETHPPGRLLIGSAFDPRADDLRATGRAVMLGHSAVAPGRLAALAQRAGFDYVCYRAGGSRSAPVYAAAAPGEYFLVELDPAAAGPIDVDAGATAALTLRPAPPSDAFVQWHTVPSGPGTGTVVPDTGPSTPQRTATLHATTAGHLTVKADLTRGRHTVSATRVVRIGLGATGLPAGASISADGTPGTPASTVDVANTFFDPAFLTRHDDARVTYGSNEDNHLMQPAVAELLYALLAELGRAGVSGQLAVTGAFNPNLDLAAQEGRELILRHSTLSADQLARSAFAVGFGHLQHSNADLFVRQAPGQLVIVRGPAANEANGVITVDEGSTVDLAALPVPASLTGPGLTPAVFGWASGTFDSAAIALGSTTKTATTLAAGSSGMAWVQASYSVGDSPAPYTFQVRLRPALDSPATVITKEQHDLIMNAINALHPVGVEVNTALIRARVIEVQGDQLLAANPEYTYPKFRVRGVLPPQVRKAGRG